MNATPRPTLVKVQRRQARKHMEQGGVTDGQKADRARVLEMFNGA